MKLGRREVLKGAAYGTAALVAGAATGPGAFAADGRPRNILLLMTDQHGPDYMGAVGSPHAITPTLDSLAASGMLFREAYCQDPVCVPARACILMGQYAHTTGTHQNGNSTSRSLISFPQHLRSNGYKTACFGKLHVKGRTDLDWNEDDPGDLSARPDPPPGSTVLSGTLRGTNVMGTPSPWGPEWTKEWQAKENTIRFMTDNKDEPWCIQCSMDKPHPAFQPPQEYWDMIDRDALDIPEYPADDLDDVHPQIRQRMVSRSLLGITEEQTRNAMQGYFGNLAFCDAMFAEVLDALDALGLRDDTLIVYTADHGEMLYHHGIWTKFTFFDQSVRVPLIFSYPGLVKSGVQTQALVEHIDMFPTLMDMVGMPTPEAMEGRSLIRVLDGRNTQHRKYVRSEFYYSSFPTMRMEFDGRYKVIDNGPDISPELYDHDADPQEIVNITSEPEHSSLVEATVNELRDWGAGAGDPEWRDGTFYADTVKAPAASPLGLGILAGACALTSLAKNRKVFNEKGSTQ